MFGAVRDEESAVRAAGLRALGMLVTLSTLEDDTGFLMDLADMVCMASDDKNLGVRVKSAWALANLCDCLSRQKFGKSSRQKFTFFPLDMNMCSFLRGARSMDKEPNDLPSTFF